MPEKTFIELLYAQKAKNDSNSQDLTNILNILSKTVFGDVNRFIFELLQNADDAPNKSSESIHVEFRLLDNYLIFKHSGAHFSQNDIVGISTVGSRASEKDLDMEKTGYKGIGFKSIFKASNCVQIISGRYSFRFDKNHSTWVNETGYPWQVIPIWTDAPPIETANYIETEKVNTIVSITDRTLIKREIQQTFEDSQIFLFLRNVASIIFYDQNNPVFKIEKKQIGNDHRELWFNNELQSNWLLRDFLIPIGQDVRDKLAKLSEEECPQKLKAATVAKITFAAQVQENKILPIENAAMYCYLPTKIKRNFPFVINADFITNAERTELLSNEWNTFLFSSIAQKHLEWISELGNGKFKYQTAKLIKPPFRYTSVENEKAYNNAFEKTIDNIAMIPSNTDQLLKIDQALTDYTGFTSAFPASPITNALQQTKNLVNLNVERTDILNGFGVEAFNIEQLCTMLEKRRLNDKAFAINETISLINFFKVQTENKINSHWNEILKNTAFLINQDGELKCPADLYYPLLQKGNAVFEFVKLQFLHPDIFAAIRNDQGAIRWLNTMGIKEPSEVEIMRKSIFNYIDAGNITDDIAVDVGKFIFRIFQAGKLQDNDYQYLSSLRIMSVNGTNLPVNCYLQASYDPQLKIDEILPGANFVSDVYLEKEEERPQWKNFFLKVGVKESIKIHQDSKRNVRSEYIRSYPHLQNYFNWIDDRNFYPPMYASYKNTAQHGVVNFSTVDYIEYTVNYSFAKTFWQMVLNSWQMFYDRCFEIEYFFYRGSVNVPSYVRYFIQNNACIPATNGNCYLPSQVYARNLKSVIGDHFPILDLDKISVEQFEYFGIRNTISTKDCLDILTSLSAKSINTDLNKQIYALYDQILKSKGDLSKADNKIINDWKKSGKFLALDNTFQPLVKLHCFNAKGIIPPVDSSHFIKLPADFKPKEIEMICEIFEIPIVSLENLKCVITGENIDTGLQSELMQKAKYLSIIYAHRQSEVLSNVYNQLNLRINSISFYTCEKISLAYSNQMGETIFEKKIETWFDKEDNFYFTGKWNSPRTMYSLIESLCDFLQLKDMDKELHMILQLNDEAIIEWLVEKGYQVPDVEAKKYNDLEHEHKDVLEEPVVEMQADVTMEVSVFTPLVRAADVDVTKVKIQYKTAENLIINTQASTAIIKDDKTKVDVGLWSEQFINKYLREKSAPGTVIIWENEKEESFKPYDFKIIENNVEKFIEVKGTSSPTKQKIYMSKFEWQFMFEKKENYTIYRLLCVGGKEEDLKMEAVQNPAEKIQNGLMLPDKIEIYI